MNSMAFGSTAGASPQWVESDPLRNPAREDKIGSLALHGCSDERDGVWLERSGTDSSVVLGRHAVQVAFR
jgi:hypothetical protein